jgi:hypothetical protein
MCIRSSYKLVKMSHKNSVLPFICPFICLSVWGYISSPKSLDEFQFNWVLFIAQNVCGTPNVHEPEWSKIILNSSSLQWGYLAPVICGITSSVAAISSHNGTAAKCPPVLRQAWITHIKLGSKMAHPVYIHGFLLSVTKDSSIRQQKNLLKATVIMTYNMQSVPGAVSLVLKLATNIV